MSDHEHSSRGHFTTRRGFIVGAGFGVVSLYGLWAAYGATPLRLIPHGDEAAPPDHTGGHGGHGRASGPAIEDFRRLTGEFVEANKLADGSVRPQRQRVAEPAGTNEHAMHGAAKQSATQIAPQPAAEPIDVYLAAYQWGYMPAVLRLEAGVPYRFRMMAVDVTHGASLQIGSRGHIIRLRAGALVEQELRFARAGEYLVYCTIYCGMLHDRMQGKIIVT